MALTSAGPVPTLPDTWFTCACGIEWLGYGAWCRCLTCGEGPQPAEQEAGDGE